MKPVDHDGVRRSVRPALTLAILLTVAAGCLLSSMDAFGKHLTVRYDVLQVVWAPFLYAQLVWAGVLSVLHFGDPLTLPMLLGTAIVVASGLYIWHRETAAAGSRH